MDRSDGEKKLFAEGKPATTGDALRRWRITVRGIVQGVGFRPFVYNTAQALGLRGWVKNTSGQVQMEIEATAPLLDSFLHRLKTQCPRQAQIDRVEVEEIPPVGPRWESFQIISSTAEEGVRPIIPADLAICEECLAEIHSPGERRFRYPFTNCTHCGPRWSIIRGLPYDRPRTSMAHFVMCAACRAEYENPTDRRFHAQPIACPECGPKLRLLMCVCCNPDSPKTEDKVKPPHSRGELFHPGEEQAIQAQGRLTGKRGEPFHPGEEQPRSIEIAQGEEALQAAARAIREGKILALKGLGGFQLLCDATRQEVVQRLRERKRRPDKPFAVMLENLDQIRRVCEVSPAEAELLQSPEAPIVLLRRRLCSDSASVPLADSLPTWEIAPAAAPGNPYLGVMLPYTPLHVLLMEAVGGPLVCTSGNLSEEPMTYRTSEALDRLGHIADLVLTHNRPIVRPVDDSVVRVVVLEGPLPTPSVPGKAHVQILRRARGYAPRPIELGVETPPILALGGHLKNTVALALGSQVVVSQHIGDLDTLAGVELHRRTVEDLLAFFQIQPELVVCDLHPDYASTQYAEQLAERWKVPLIRVQHHSAHLAACLAEQGLSPEELAEPILGFSWDGAGYGEDRTVWGGEMLLWQGGKIVRVGTLRSFSLPGGDQAVREPRRSALGVLYEILGEEAFERLKDWFRPSERIGLASMLRRGVHAPRTTSVGRLFDAAAALCGLGERISFEGQAAMALEFAALDNTGITSLENADFLEHVSPYPFPWREPPEHPTEKKSGGPKIPASEEEPSVGVLDWEPMFRAILMDRSAGGPAAPISRRFHESLADAIVQATQWAARKYDIHQVALSGGCFQNALLTQRAYARLTEAGFRVYLHRQVPPGDGGIALGQIFLAAWKLHSPTPIQ